MKKKEIELRLFAFKHAAELRPLLLQPDQKKGLVILRQRKSLTVNALSKTMDVSRSRADWILRNLYTGGWVTRDKGDNLGKYGYGAWIYRAVKLK